MSRPIQALAPGYLGLLGLKNNGKLPLDQHDTVQPIVNIEPYYLQGVRQGISGSFPLVAGSSGNTTLFTVPVAVPEGKVWHILGGTLFLGIAAGQVFSASIRLMAAGTLTALDRVLSDAASVGAPNTAAVAALSTIAIGVPIPEVMLRGQDAVILLVEWANGVGAGTATVRLTYAEFQE